MNKFIVLALLLLVGCTSSHRIVAIYESGDAVTGAVTVLEKPTAVKYERGEQAPTAEKEDAEESNSIFDSFTDMLSD